MRVFVITPGQLVLALVPRTEMRSNQKNTKPCSMGRWRRVPDLRLALAILVQYLSDQKMQIGGASDSNESKRK